jgi:hypothetical protein
METFAEHLQQFARSIDIVSDDALEHVRGLVTQYIRSALKIDYFEMMLETIVDGKPGLKTFWTTGIPFANSLRYPNGDYQGQTAFAFVQNVELWIVGEGGQTLVDAPSYIDKWSGCSSVPSYRNPMIDRIKTSIILPLRDEGRVFGVLDLESTTFLEITRLAKTELAMIAESISMLYQLQRASKIQRESTQKALQQLGLILRTRNSLSLSKPKLFLASSSKADQRVNAVLRRVLDTYSSWIEVTPWYEISKSGNINQHIIREILSSSYGVCYFSEAVDGPLATRYQDNPNVLFEAGMLHVLSYTDQNSSEGWLPIRERKSPELPFDFATERILMVPRLQDGSLNVPDFENELRQRLDTLLDNLLKGN